MALQGTIDAFPLTDVLQLLSSSKTGCLVLDGDRGRATLWIEDGRVVGGGPATTPSPDPETLVFEMLRFRSGSFVFDAEGDGDGPEVVVPPTPLPDCLRAAESLIEQWSEIEAVVPSLAHRVGLATSIDQPSVTISADDWQLLRGAGVVPTLAELVASVGMGEYDGAAAVANLVLAGVLEVTDPIPELARERVEVPRDLTAPAVAEDVVTAFPERFPIDDLMGAEEQAASESWRPEHSVMTPAAHSEDGWDQLLDETLDTSTPPAATPVIPTPVAPAPVAALPAVEVPAATGPLSPGSPSGGPTFDSDPEESTDEVLRQVARLSPQAAEAVAAALQPDQNGSERGASTDGPGPFFGAL